MRYDITTSSDGLASIQLNMEKLDIPDIPSDSPLFTFPVKAYPNLYNKDESGNRLRYVDCGALDAINNFFKTLSDDDLMIIALTLLLVHNRICKAFEQNDMKGLSDVCHDCAQLIMANFVEIHLMTKFKIFIEENVNVVIEEGWGSRPIDTEDMTYGRQDVIDLHVLVFLGKLMIPIFGAIITRAQGYDLGEKVAEIHCVSFIMPLINMKAAHTKNKLVRYIRAITAGSFAEDATVFHSGFSRNYTETILMAMFLVRNAVNHDVYREGSNLITALNGCITKTSRTFRNKAKQSNHIEGRSSKSVVADEQNQSQMEIDSILSSKTSDIVVIAKTFSSDVVNDFLRLHDLDRDIHNQVVRHIFENAVSVNRVSQFIVQSVFCTQFSGISNLNFLQIEEMAHLLAATQQLIANYGFDELTHALTVRRTGNVRTEQTDTDKSLLLGYNKSREYRMYINLLEELPLSVKEMKRQFNELMLEIVTDVTNYEYTYCTSRDIGNVLGQTAAKNTVVQFSEVLMRQIYQFLYDMWSLKV